jgi:hypothetical protein
VGDGDPVPLGDAVASVLAQPAISTPMIPIARIIRTGVAPCQRCYIDSVTVRQPNP